MSKTTKIVEHSKNKTIQTQEKAINAINEMIENGEEITFYSVRQKTGISKSFLYNNKVVNELIKQNITTDKKRIDSPEHIELLKAQREIKALKEKIKELEEELALLQNPKAIKKKSKNLEKTLMIHYITSKNIDFEIESNSYKLINEEGIELESLNITDIKGLSKRTKNALLRNGISTVEEILNKKYEDFIKVKGLGKKCTEEIVENLKKYVKISK